jgi:excisionase family DNA binding protein
MATDKNPTPITSGLLFTGIDPDGIKQLIQDVIAEGLAKLEIPRPIEPRFVNQHQLAKILGKSVPTITRMRKDGRIPFARIGNKLMFEVNEVWEALKTTENKRKK